MVERWVVKAGNDTLNIVHPDEKRTTDEALKKRAIQLRDAWVASNLFIGESVSVVKENI